MTDTTDIPDAAATRSGTNPYRTPVGPVRRLEATTEASPALQSVVVDWEPPADGRLIDHYRLYASPTAAFDEDTAELFLEPPVSRFVHASLGPEPQTWHYRVVAVDAAGNVGRFRESPTTSATTAQGFMLGATASSRYNDAHAPEFAVDGSMASRWAGARADDEWIQVELARPITSGRVELYWQGAYARDYDLLTSPDGDTWTVVHSVRDKPDAAMDVIDVGGAGEFRFVRMHGFVRATTWGFSLWEFWVHPPS